MTSTSTLLAFITLLLSGSSLQTLAQATGDRPFISELVAVGNDSFQDEDGNTPDWLEIYNPTNTTLDLTGYHLTDDALFPTKWTFPSVQMPPGTYLTIFASDKDRAISGSPLHTNFRLSGSGEYLALIEPDGATIASEYSPAFPAQGSGFSYGVDGLAPDDDRGYFGPATPGTTNGSLLTAPLIAPLITPPCATFSTDIEVTIAPAFVGGQVRYTTDGSAPTSASPLYNNPLTLSTTTHLRARTFDPQTNGGGIIAGGQFQKLSGTSNLTGINSPATFTSDLPIMIVENFGNGTVPGPGQTLQTARVSVFEVDPITGRSSLSETPDACFRIGIRRRGQSSSGFAKPQYRVELRDEDDEDLDYPLLGLPSESDWVFNGPWTDKSLVRNSFSFDLGRTLGNEAPGTRHFEMFLSTNGGDLISSEYVGVYALFENIKLSRNRTDLTELSPSDNAEPEITGGYMLRFEPPGIAGQGIRATGWNSVEIIEPSAPTTAQRNYVGQYFDDFVATLGWSRGSGANNNGIVNPDPITGYPAFINVDSFVNHFIISELGRDQDAYVRSDYMFKDRDGKLNKGPIWDHNLIMGTGCCFDNKNPMGWQYLNNYNRGGRDHSYEPDWFVPLMRDPDFRQHVTDRWSELRRGGPFQLNNLLARLDAQADPLAEAAVRNFSKWNNLSQNGPGFSSPSTTTWEGQIDFMKGWLTDRTQWIDLQFLMVPEFNPASSLVLEVDDEVAVQSENTIYYTTDGSDPRLAGGEINPNALILPPSLGSVPATFFTRESEWTFLDDGSDQGLSNIVIGDPSYNVTNWKHPDFDDSGWSDGNGIFGFGGIGDPRVTFGSLLDRGPSSGRHQSYYFRKSFQINDASDVFTLQANVLRDDGVIIYLNGNEVARSNVPVGAVLGFEDLSGGVNPSSVEEGTYFTVSLDPAFLVDGENVICVALHQLTDGSSDVGFDLELVGTVAPGDAPTIAFPATAMLRARSRNDQEEWSGLNEAIFVVGEPANSANLVISEINYRPAAPSPSELVATPGLTRGDFEWLEIRNLSSGDLDLSGISFVDGITFEAPVGTSLAPGAYAVIVSNPAAFELRYGPGLPVIGAFSGSLSNDGEQVRLDDFQGSPIADFTYNDIWYRESDGDGFTLVLRNENAIPADYSDLLAWQASATIEGTPGGPNIVLDPGFIIWQNANFTAAELTDTLVSGPLADPDGDTLTNLLEYGMGLAPKSPNPESLPALSSVTFEEESYLALSFQRQQGLAGLAFSIEVSPDLENWAESTLPFGTPVDNGNGTETIILRHSLPISPSDPLQMIRLKIAAP